MRLSRRALLSGAAVTAAAAVTIRAKQPVRALQFSGESQIVGHDGTSVAIRHFAEGEGVLVGEIYPGRVPPSEDIPDGRFWTPEGPGDASTFWQTSGAAGREVYLRRRVAG